MKTYQACCLFIFALLISFEAGATIYKCIDSDGQITYTKYKKEGCSKLDLLDPRWILLYENIFAEESLHYDSESIVKTNNMVKVWTLKQKNESSTKELFTIDCSTRTYLKLQGETQSASNIDKPMNIAPESDIEMIYSKLCSGN